MILERLQSNEPLEGTIDIPPLGTVTQVSGTGAFLVTVETLRAFNGDGALTPLIEALVEQEYLYAMVTLSPDATGIDNMIYMIPAPEGPHGPRVKIMIDPPLTNRRGGKESTVPFDGTTHPPVSAKLERQLREFIAVNRLALTEFWNLEISGDQLVRRLRRP